VEGNDGMNMRGKSEVVQVLFLGSRRRVEDAICFGSGQ
jgi:hypothetical protein